MNLSVHTLRFPDARVGDLITTLRGVYVITHINHDAPHMIHMMDDSHRVFYFHVTGCAKEIFLADITVRSARVIAR
jgi:NMD protein affecting ribosome stability and mRNA decay